MGNKKPRWNIKLSPLGLDPVTMQAEPRVLGSTKGLGQIYKEMESMYFFP